MPICSRCKNQVKVTDLTCGYCGLQLKAHGHPSIELHQTLSEEVLCKSCAYHADDSCTFPQRPYAKACTLYQSIAAETEQITYQPRSPSLQTLWQRHKIWLILLALFGISLLLTFF
ncbi:MAG: zinc ribbon domain-containing protein [Leptolyngbya sp. SIO1D8]|nr:zinc ribbon domain-containing protein [Leptolyngbya sp. SIO1D8]